MINNWFQHFFDSWFNFSKLTILSFHNLKGDIIQDTMDAADPAVLLPVINRPLNTCRKANVKYVRVQITINFATLVNVNPPGPTTMHAKYYIKLPQTLVQMTNWQNTAYNLLTFHGASDLRTLSAADFQTQILNVTLQDGPVNLQPACFNLSTAWTNSTELQSNIESTILRLAFATVCNTLFLELCPGYSNQPHTAIDHSRQVYNNCDGNQVVSTIQAYFQQLMGAAHPFSSQRDFPVSICAKFQDGLDPHLQTGYRQYFPQHSVVQSLNATHQRKTLQAMLQAAQQAEDDLHAVQRVAREAVGLSWAFHVSASGGVHQDAGVFPSQAKKTLARYSPSGEYSPTDGFPAATSGNRGAQTSTRAWNCFGCGGLHPYSELRDGTHIVICPNRDNPGIRENAAKNKERMRKNRKK
jgi:hypothetical protein